VKRDKEEGRRAVISFAIFSIPLAGLGLALLFAPYAMWYAGEGWAYKNLEPSEATLALIRIGGGVLLLVLAILWGMILRNALRVGPAELDTAADRGRAGGSSGQDGSPPGPGR
jgi:hypothetical protein